LIYCGPAQDIYFEQNPPSGEAEFLLRERGKRGPEIGRIGKRSVYLIMMAQFSSQLEQAGNRKKDLHFPKCNSPLLVSSLIWPRRTLADE
jgi:hypothetical protein